jgi:dTDP-4-amino-4,6-dideoxygalactose transaminase
MVLSFYPTKQFNCIEGGAVLHNSTERAEIIKDLRYYEHQTDFSGQARYNLRMPNLHAAFGCVLLDDIEKRYTQLDQLRANYCYGIKNEKLLIPAQCSSGVVPWRFLIKSEKEHLFENLRRAEIQTDQELTSLQAGFQFNDAPLWFKSYQSIPFFDKMTKEEQNHVIQEINGSSI